MQHQLLDYPTNGGEASLGALALAGYAACKIALRNDINPHDFIDAVMRVCFDEPELRAKANRWTAYDGDTRRVALPQIVWQRERKAHAQTP